MPLTKLVHRVFSGFFEVLLWLTLIAGAYAGSVIGNLYGGLPAYGDYGFFHYFTVSDLFNIGRYFDGSYTSGAAVNIVPALLGALIGLVVAFIVDVTVGGLTATFLRIAHDTADVKKRLSENPRAYSAPQAPAQPQTATPARPTPQAQTAQPQGFAGSKKCGRCNQPMPADAAFCPSCGAQAPREE